jgi:hypothetical protein
VSKCCRIGRKPHFVTNRGFFRLHFAVERTFPATHERRPMSEQTPQIRVVDDDPEIRKLLARYLEARDQLMDLTRGREGDVPDRSIDILVGRLRRKLGTSGTSRLFKTVRNGGYQLAVEVAVQDLPS